MAETPSASALKPSTGGKALEAYIRSRGLSIPDWCELVGLRRQRISIQYLIRPEREKRVSVNLAFAIQYATRGQVPAELFVTEYLVPVTGAARRRKSA